MAFSSLTPSRLCFKICGGLLGLATALVLAGCSVASINSLYEDVTPKDPDIVFEKGIIGAWTASDAKCVTTVTITSNEDIYDLQSVDEGQGCPEPAQKIRQQARLVRLGTYYFLDISSRPDDVCEACLALHQIFLTSFTKDTITLIPIDADGLRAAISAKKVTLSTVPEDPKMIIPERPLTLTALSKDLKAFCHGFAEDKTVFKPESAEMLKRTQLSGPRQ